MRFVALISSIDQLLTKLLFIRTRLISGDKNDGFSLRIECKCGPPNSVSRIKPKLLHICVVRTIKGISAWPSKLRSTILEKQDQCSQFDLYLLVELPELPELPSEVLIKYHIPRHWI